MIAYYFRNPEFHPVKGSPLSKIVDGDETSQAYEDINEIITELTEKHKTTVLAILQGGKE